MPVRTRPVNSYGIGKYKTSLLSQFCVMQTPKFSQVGAPLLWKKTGPWALAVDLQQEEDLQLGEHNGWNAGFEDGGLGGSEAQPLSLASPSEASPQHATSESHLRQENTQLRKELNRVKEVCCQLWLSCHQILPIEYISHQTLP